MSTYYQAESSYLSISVIMSQHKDEVLIPLYSNVDTRKS